MKQEGGQNWTPITPPEGSIFHAETQADFSRLSVLHPWNVDHRSGGEGQRRIGTAFTLEEQRVHLDDLQTLGGAAGA